MGLPTGTRLGPYEVESLLGSGGMGEVYRARDTRLERIVAVKVLPASLSAEPSSRLRLEREAKSISRLSHPYICTLHDLGHDSGKDYLVMELVEGETLEHRIAKGPLPPDQALRIGIQIAEALAAAHKHGIVHRDLKPSNVMLTKTGAKLMDFGLAKESAIAPLSSALAEMSTQQAKLTEEGTIVGTFQYMAPEQLEGHATDARADIFAFGVLLYEMLTGEPAFKGKSRASLIAAILTAEPKPIITAQPLTPAAVERVVKKCLAKDPDERWQSARDLADELRWMSELGSQALAVSIESVGWKKVAGLATAVAIVAFVLAAIAWFHSPSPIAQTMLFQAPVPFGVNAVAVSPDGTTAAMVAYSEIINNNMIWMYPMGGHQPKALEGTQGASYPFWSPDGRSLAFFADGKLKKLDIEKGQIQTLADAPNGRGGSWGSKGVIVFSPDATHGVYTISPAGGVPTELVPIDPAQQETSARWPAFLPDGEHFLFLGANFSGRVEKNAIYVGKLGSSERHRVLQASSNALYAAGYLLYVRDRNLWAQPFDLNSLTVNGEARIVAENVLFFPAVFHGAFSAVDGKTLITETGTAANISHLSWFDRTGKRLSTVGEPGWFGNLRLSPDGRRIALDKTDGNGQNVDVWLHDSTTGSSQRFTFTPSLDQAPVWSPDGKQIAYVSNQDLGWNILRKQADGSSPDETLVGFKSELVTPWDWSPDGETILMRRFNHVWLLSPKERSVRPLIEGTGAIKNARFAPNGHWIAFSSNESGKAEIYVVPFPLSSGKWQVSNGGGEEPIWARDGKELFFLAPDGNLMAVPVTATDHFESRTPVALFQTHRRQAISSQDVFSYDVSKDRRFLIPDKGEKTEAAPLSVYLNWTSEMQK
jgi:Tol biopolymer transport system component